MKSILITGGAGFIGSHVIRLFVKKYPEYKIYNLDKLTYAGNLENISASSTFSNVDYEIRETPVYEVGTGRFAINEVFGVDEAEIEETRDDNSQYHPAHAGWVGITTYNNADGTLRVKTEVLVASNSITGDSGDDTVLPDS